MKWFTLSAVLLAAVPGPRAAAELIVQSNAGGSFIWRPTHTPSPGFPGGTQAGNAFDPTLPASSNPTAGATSLTATSGTGGTSSTYVDAFFSAGPSIRIARGITPVTIPGIPQVQQLRAAVFTPGQSVGPANAGAEWAGAASYSYSRPTLAGPQLGQSPFIGIRLELATGVHYGWIELDWRSVSYPSGLSIGAYQPVRWAYESVPNVPALVPAPGAGALLGAAGIVALRRRRRAA